MNTDEIRYQVFVSSTFSDLKDEREKVLQAILQLRAFPAGMELFPAADEEQFEFIKREIDSSDYYIVIIAGRYGNLSDSGVSFTEMEYDYARAQGKPILAFITRDIGKLIGDRLESTDALREKLRSFTEKAKKSKLVNFFSNPDELKSAVLASLPAQFNLKPMRGWVHAGQTSRDTLEEISTLQREVLKLREQNETLRKVTGDAEGQLAHGSDEVCWHLSLNDFVLDNQWPQIRDLDFTCTWDELLTAIFSSGSSQALERQVRERIGVLILEKYPNQENTWKVLMADGLKKYQTLPKFSAVETIFGDVLRQFNGLGLVQEGKETLHRVPQFGGPQISETVDVWRLTPKGQQQLAAAKGYRRDSSNA